METPQATTLDLSPDEVRYLVKLIEDDLGNGFFEAGSKVLPGDEMAVTLIRRLTSHSS